MRTFNVRRDYRHEFYAHDDFFGLSYGSGATTAEMGWILSSAGTSGFAGKASELGHPGLFTLSTGATSATVAGMTCFANGVGMLHVDDLFDFMVVMRLNNNDTDTQVRVGLFTATGDPSSNGIYFEKLYADTNWQAVTRYGATQTRAAMAAVSTSWVTLRVRRYAANDIRFSIDGGAETKNTTNVPTGLSLNLSLQIKNQAASSKTMDIDFTELWIPGLSRT